MSNLVIAAVIASCAAGAALTGLFVRSRLPGDAVASQALESIKLSVGLLATLVAISLGLLISNAATTLMRVDAQVKDFSGDSVLLDTALSDLGAPAEPARDALRRYIRGKWAEIWPEEVDVEQRPAPSETGASLRIEDVRRELLKVSPTSEVERAAWTRGLALSASLTKSGWLLLQQPRVISRVVFAILMLWVSSLFFAFGFLSPFHPVVLSALAICSLSVTAALFLVVESGRPLTGLLKISGAPLHSALVRVEAAP